MTSNVVTPKKQNAVSPVHVAITAQFGWRFASHDGLEVWCKGYGSGIDAQKLCRRLQRLSPTRLIDRLQDFMAELDGHFALVARRSDWTVAAVDRVRSIPIAFAQGPDGWTVDDQALRLKHQLGLNRADPEAVRAIAMAGYTVGDATLFKGIEQLAPGECVLFRKGRKPQRKQYYTYRPWRNDKPPFHSRKAQAELTETTLGLIDCMMKSVDGRMLVVPLSAGMDSRLIVSAARHLGYRNVRTFAYGLQGNHEATTSKRIAEALGYDWRFVPTSPGFMRRYFSSADWQGYADFSDSLQATPFVQDMPQIQVLKKQGYIPDDAVFANGNSGDFISGNHIVPPMDTVSDTASLQKRKERITGTFYRKHFLLWRSLLSETSEKRIRNAIWASIESAGGKLGEPGDDYGLYEYAEFRDRQCKYVIAGQRIYEYLGHEWRLPLWDRLLLDFFEAVPLAWKSGQRLYRDMLMKEDWGGVWQGVPVNRKVIKPDWIRPLRLAAKVAHAPLGRDAWHRFERRYFQYWMEQGSQSAIRTYGDVIRDRRDARHGVAWLTEAYLLRHGLGIDGAKAVSDA